MLELVYILRAVVEEVACGGEGGEGQKCGKPMPPIKFSELEHPMFDVLWQKERIAIYATVWEIRKELERLADLGFVKFEDDEVRIENSEEFLKRTEPYLLIIRNLVGGNNHLDHVLRRIGDCARRYAADNIKRGIVPQPV